MKQVQEQEKRLAVRDLRKLPKVDLHVHLECAIRSDTLRRLAQSNGVDLPESLLAEGYTFRDFEDFRAAVHGIRPCLCKASDFSLAGFELCHQHAAEGVRYFEVSFTLGATASGWAIGTCQFRPCSTDSSWDAKGMASRAESSSITAAASPRKSQCALLSRRSNTGNAALSVSDSEATNNGRLSCLPAYSWLRSMAVFTRFRMPAKCRDRRVFAARSSISRPSGSATAFVFWKTRNWSRSPGNVKLLWRCVPPQT